ncbi:hypothetical protein V1287_004783 [Bradyrhizobium sp. AZCC 1699]
MKRAALPLAVLLDAAYSMTFAQGASEAMAHLRACSNVELTARQECLETMPRNITQAAAADSDNWLVSETTSPVDYSPVVVATTSSRGGSDSATMQLSIHCRGGRTELVITGPGVSRSAEEYLISYRVNDDLPVQLPAARPSFGVGVAPRGDVVRMLQSLPDEGEFAVRLTSRTGVASEGHFLLGGLKTVREKLATACKWPHAVARPRN